MDTSKASKAREDFFHYFADETRNKTVKIGIFHLQIRIQREKYVFFILPLTIPYLVIPNFKK